MTSKNPILDVLERTVWTALQAGAAVVIAQQNFNVLTWKAAGIAAGLALVKGLAALQIGNKSSASLP